MQWIERGIEERDPILVTPLKIAATYDPLRSLPRFHALLRKMNRDKTDWRKVCSQVDSVIRGVQGMNWRNNTTVFLAKDPLIPLNAVWERVKHCE